MKKILEFIIEAVFWIQLFITPVIIGGLMALFIYISNQKLLWLSIVIMILSVVTGLIYAERIRKKYGASRYLSKALGTPDIWPDENPQEIEARAAEEQSREQRKNNSN